MKSLVSYFTDLTDPRGVVETPVFMSVGTQGAVKAVHISELKDDIHTPVILGNTYHLYLRPGLEILEKVGGCISSTAGTGRS
jgi:queuine tRNA-ribosyltransferase